MTSENSAAPNGEKPFLSKVVSLKRLLRFARALLVGLTLYLAVITVLALFTLIDELSFVLVSPHWITFVWLLGFLASLVLLYLPPFGNISVSGFKAYLLKHFKTNKKTGKIEPRFCLPDLLCIIFSAIFIALLAAIISIFTSQSGMLPRGYLISGILAVITVIIYIVLYEKVGVSRATSLAYDLFGKFPENDTSAVANFDEEKEYEKYSEYEKAQSVPAKIKSTARYLIASAVIAVIMLASIIISPIITDISRPVYTGSIPYGMHAGYIDCLLGKEYKRTSRRAGDNLYAEYYFGNYQKKSGGDDYYLVIFTKNAYSSDDGVKDESELLRNSTVYAFELNTDIKTDFSQKKVKSEKIKTFSVNGYDVSAVYIYYTDGSIIIK